MVEHVSSMSDLEHIGDIIERNFERWNGKRNVRSKIVNMSNEELLNQAEDSLVWARTHLRDTTSSESLNSIAASLLVIAREMSTKDKSTQTLTTGLIGPDEYNPNLMKKDN